jgi:hypothetical protein
MTQQQLSDLDRALLRANRRGILILATGTRKPDGARIYLTNSGSLEDGTHWVIVSGNRLTCDCASRVICVHKAIVHARLVSEHAAALVVQAAKQRDIQAANGTKAGPEHAAPRTDNRAFSIFK